MDQELFDSGENDLWKSVRRTLRSIDSDLSETCDRMENDLRRLSEVFSHYSSIMEDRSLGGEVHSIDTLIDVLYRDGADHTILLPTKVIVGRSFIVAKFNFFGYLLTLSELHEELSSYRVDLQKTWERAIFSLLVEDVYQVIVERDRYYRPAVRRQAAVDLIHMWEYRFDQYVNEYASIVVDLWRARRRIAPVFGTMLGTMEMMNLSSLLPDRWYEFISAHGDQEQAMQALEEFIFGLTYESIQVVRNHMEDHNITSVDRQALEKMLGPEDRPQEINSTDPREMYRFFQRRTRRLVYRRLGGSPGPHRTLEEILLVHLIEEVLENRQS